VIIANINWNKENKDCGIVGARDHGAAEVTSLKNRWVEGSPIKPPIDVPKHKL
jgi:hypothetical protein